MLNITIPTEESHIRPKIVVLGVGGAGGNAVNNMIRSELEGVQFAAANTDAQALAANLSEKKIQLGQSLTQGLGAGSRPDIGRAAAEENIDEIMGLVDGSNMAFITAGMGGGTGTGAASVIARCCREAGVLTVGVVTKPFRFEGAYRMRMAEEGIAELQHHVDTLIIIPNQNLFRIANEKTTFAQAFSMADDVLHAGVRGVTDLMVMPGLINLDFNDIRTVMSEMGKAMMGTGEAEGDNRAIAAADAAISNPLLDDVSMKGARGVLINITGGMDMTLHEVDEAANRIGEQVDPQANIIFGSTFDESMDGIMRVSVVATGIDCEAGEQPHPQSQSDTSSRYGSGRVATGASYGGNRVDARATQSISAATEGATARKIEDVQETVSELSPQAEMQSVINDSRLGQATSNSSYTGTPAPKPSMSERGFIPPRPVTPEEAKQDFLAHPPKEVELRATPTQAEKLAPATPSLGAVPATKKPKSLLERVASLGRKSQEREPAKIEPFGQENREAAKTDSKAETSDKVQSQLDLGSINQTRPQTSQSDDDMLEIPTFLRRQAN